VHECVNVVGIEFIIVIEEQINTITALLAFSGTCTRHMRYLAPCTQHGKHPLCPRKVFAELATCATYVCM
jgi:hypothetical protein